MQSPPVEERKEGLSQQGAREKGWEIHVDWRGSLDGKHPDPNVLTEHLSLPPGIPRCNCSLLLSRWDTASFIDPHTVHARARPALNRCKHHHGVINK